MGQYLNKLERLKITRQANMHNTNRRKIVKSTLTPEIDLTIAKIHFLTRYFPFLLLPDAVSPHQFANVRNPILRVLSPWYLRRFIYYRSVKEKNLRAITRRPTF